MLPSRGANFAPRSAMAEKVRTVHTKRPFVGAGLGHSTAVLETNSSCRGASEWLDGALSAEDVDAMVKWLKEASKTAALGRSVEKARLFSASRKKVGFERTESQQLAIETLKGLRSRDSSRVVKKGRP